MLSEGTTTLPLTLANPSENEILFHMFFPNPLIWLHGIFLACGSHFELTLKFHSYVI